MFRSRRVFHGKQLRHVGRQRSSEAFPASNIDTRMQAAAEADDADRGGEAAFGHNDSTDGNHDLPRQKHDNGYERTERNRHCNLHHYSFAGRNQQYHSAIWRGRHLCGLNVRSSKRGRWYASLQPVGQSKLCFRG